MKRRAFLKQGLIGSGLVALSSTRIHPCCAAAPVKSQTRRLPTIRSITPVVGDGRWVWNDPPRETGYLEPRDYELEIGIHLDGTGPAQLLKATTPLPVELPEQEIKHAEIETRGCQAVVRPVSNEAAQLAVTAPSISKGQAVSAISKMRLRLFKQYHGFTKEQFDPVQPAAPIAFKRQYLFDSPGIQTRAPQVRKLREDISGGSAHPWDRAHQFYQWVWENIHARIGDFTGVVRALKSRVGDCEERAAVFVALCRSAGIPARLVWVPNHNWAEFFLVDTKGKGHWIPAHTSAYSWFGWTGVHELVLQKGDNLFVPEKKQPQRLLADWMQWQGAKPKTRFTAQIRPLANQSSDDAGPGERVKDNRGEWVLKGSHSLDRALRDGHLANQQKKLIDH